MKEQADQLTLTSRAFRNDQLGLFYQELCELTHSHMALPMNSGADVGFSTEPQYRDGYAPFTPGFKIIPFGDANALERAITPNTVAFLVEPIQGEAGVIVPPQGYLKQVREWRVPSRGWRSKF